MSNPRVCGPKGPEDSPFVIVGEAPGKEELIEGVPFIGPSGQVLNDALGAHFGRKTVTKTYSRPSELHPGKLVTWQKDVEVVDRHTLIFPGDYPEPYFLNTLDIPMFGQDKTPALMTQLAMEARPALLEKIRKHPRKIILALGAVAAQALLDMPGLKITKNRGMLFASDLAEVGILASIHPAFLLRGGGSWRQFKADVTYAIELAQGKTTRRWTPPTFSYVRNLNELLHHAQIIRSLPKGRVNFVAFDKETEDFQPMQGDILNLGYTWTGNHVYILCGKKYDAIQAGLWNGMKFANVIFEACKESGARQTWHNGKFDCRWAHYHNMPDAQVDEDTMLMSYALDEQRGVHDLETVAHDWVYSPDWKNELDQHKKKKQSYQVIPYQVLFKYAAYDIANTYRLAPILRREINLDPVAKKQYERSLIPASAFLLDLEKRGIAADIDQILKNQARMEAEAAPHMHIMREWADKIGLEQHNDKNYYTEKFLNSPKQLCELIFDDLGIKNADGTLPPRSTGKDIVEKLADHPFLQALRKYRKIHKGLSTYVKNLMPDPDNEEDQYDVQPDGRVHATYLIHGTATGRLSSRGPNMQNIPRDPELRGQFIAPPGRMFIEADLNQAEIRSLAILSRDPDLCKVYTQKGLGLHDKVRIDIFGAEKDWDKPTYHRYLDKWHLTPETRFVRDPNTGKVIEDQLIHEMKMRAKNVNFGIIYGITNIGLAEQIEDTPAEAQTYLDTWARSFPVAWEFIQNCRMAPIRGQNLVTVFGYRKRFRVVTPDNAIAIQNEAANFPHQNTAALITTQAGIRTYELLRQYDTFFVNTVHDSQLLEAPLDYEIAKKVTAIITGEMEQVPRDWGLTHIPFKSDAKWGTRWGHLGDMDDFAISQGWKEAA